MALLSFQIIFFKKKTCEKVILEISRGSPVNFNQRD